MIFKFENLFKINLEILCKNYKRKQKRKTKRKGENSKRARGTVLA
jgi:hypothetical protein